MVKDRTETVSNLTVSPTGLSAGDTVLFQGRIEADHMGVMIDPLPAGLTFEFSAESSPIATNRASTAILVGSPFDGNFIHAGSAMSSFSGITFAHTFSGTALNSGRVMADQISVMFGAGTFSGEFTNTGNIKGVNEGVFVVGSFEGTVLNRGTIEGTQGYGIHLMHGNGGVVRNDGGRVVGEKMRIIPARGMVKLFCQEFHKSSGESMEGRIQTRFVLKTCAASVRRNMRNCGRSRNRILVQDQSRSLVRSLSGETLSPLRRTSRH